MTLNFFPTSCRHVLAMLYKRYDDERAKLSIFCYFSHHISISLCSTSRTLQLEIQVSPQSSVSSLSELSPSVSEGEEQASPHSAASSIQSTSDLNETLTTGECAYLMSIDNFADGLKSCSRNT